MTSKNINKINYRYATVEELLGNGSIGHVYKVCLTKKDEFDSPIVRCNKRALINIFARKKYCDKIYWKYEMYHVNEMFNTNSNILKQYFCEVYEFYSYVLQRKCIFSTTIAKNNKPPYDSTTFSNNKEEKNYYLEMEYLNAPRWYLLSHFFYTNTNKELEQQQAHYKMAMEICKTIIKFLLLLHFSCNGMTYYDIKQNNIFIDVVVLKNESKIRLKFVDFGGLFSKNLLDNGKMCQLASMSGIYFLPNPTAFNINKKSKQKNIICLTKKKKFLPVFYSIVCAVNMCLCLGLGTGHDNIKGEEKIIELSRGKNMITNILNKIKETAAFMKTEEIDEEKLYSNYNIQNEFINYLHANIECLDAIELIKK